MCKKTVPFWMHNFDLETNAKQESHLTPTFINFETIRRTLIGSWNFVMISSNPTIRNRII